MAEAKKQALLGYRAWNIRRNGLESIGMGKTIWSPGPMRAECISYRDHKAPVADCDCGLYAYKSFERAEQVIDKSPLGNRVIGSVAARGYTRVHPEGFRAEEMMIIALYNPSGSKKISGLARYYGVPVFENKREFLDFNNQLGLAQLKSQPLTIEDKANALAHLAQGLNKNIRSQQNSYQQALKEYQKTVTDYHKRAAKYRQYYYRPTKTPAPSETEIKLAYYFIIAIGLIILGVFIGMSIG